MPVYNGCNISENKLSVESSRTLNLNVYTVKMHNDLYTNK